MKRVWFSLAALLAVAAILYSNNSATAAPDSAQGLQISPVIVELNADKGKSYTLKLSILNVTSGDLVFKMLVNDFRAKDETGKPEVLLDSKLPASASVVSWVQTTDSIPLKSKETRTLEVRVTVPTDAEPGGHYGVIRFSGTAPELQETGVSLAVSVGTLLLVRVDGQITEKLNLKEFFTQQGDKRSGWFSSGPVTFVARINNIGNVHLKPQGDLVVTNMFGKTVASLKVNEAKGNVLPTSTRRFEETLEKKRLFGKYTATFNLTYGTQGQVLMGSTVFWIIPWQQILLALIALAMIIAILIIGIKRYNRWLIKRSRRR